MRRPEINRFIAISPQPNVYDFSFFISMSNFWSYLWEKDEVVPNEYLTDLNKRLSEQKGIKVEFEVNSRCKSFFFKK